MFPRSNSWALTLALALLTACLKDRVDDPPVPDPPPPDPSILVKADPSTADWTSLYATLITGAAHCAPDHVEFPAGSGKCGLKGGSNPQAGKGRLGFKQLRDPEVQTDLAEVFTDDCGGGDWSEQWISSDPAKHKTNAEYPMTFYGLSSTPLRLPQGTIDDKCPSSPCSWKYASQVFEYVALPSQSTINALPAELPSDATFHQTYLIKNRNGNTTVESGRLFRVITGSGSSETWHDHWVLFDEFALVGGSNSMEIHLVTSTGDDGHSPAYGPHGHLKDFLNDMRNDGAFDEDEWDYVQIHYAWQNMPGTAPVGCPPS